jgi:multimeric flavodoxin WrbA
MKVLGIVCSPRRGGNTEILVNEALDSAKDLRAEVELVTICDKKIAPCDACESCKTTRKCRIEDDMQEIYSKLTEADGIILGTPVYFWSVTAQAKALIDRTYVFREGRRLKNKVAGAIVVARRSGATSAFSLIHDFFNIQRMVSAAGAVAYGREEEIGPDERGGGVIAYGHKKGDVRQDSQGMAEARALGRAIVRTIKLYKEKGII